MTVYRLVLTLLAYGNSRFCFLKFTKPDGEHLLQVFHRSQACFIAHMTMPGMLQLATNTDNIVHKLVTIFADQLDSFILTNNQFEHLKTTVTSGSGQISVQMTLIPFAGLAKIAPYSPRTGIVPRPTGTSPWPDTSSSNVS